MGDGEREQLPPPDGARNVHLQSAGNGPAFGHKIELRCLPAGERISVTDLTKETAEAREYVCLQ